MSLAADAQAGASFFLDVDASGLILRCEGDTFGTLGLSSSAVEGISLYDLVSDEDVWLATDAVESVLRTGGRHDDRLGFNDHVGGSIPFRVRLSKLTKQGGLGVVRLFAMHDEGGGVAGEEAGAVEDVADILADVERDLRDAVYDDPTLSVYSLDAENADDGDIDAILAAADRMTSSVALAAEGRGRAFRVDEKTVSVLHGAEFDAESVSQRAAEAAGPDYGVDRAAIDLADADIDVQEKLDVIEKMITATRLADVRLQAGEVQSPAQARSALDQSLERRRTSQSFSLEVAYSTTSGEPVLALLSFDNPLSALSERPTAEEHRIALDLLRGRIEAAGSAAEAQGAPACVEMDAVMLARLGRGAADAFKPNVLVLASGARALTDKDGAQFAAVFNQAKRAIVDGVDLAQSSALQRLISKTGNVEFIRVPRDRFGPDPAAVAESFRQIAQLCARRDVALYVNGVDDVSTAMQLREVARICIGGPAVFPGLFTD
ncbi:MAG: PAS domain-containing protein [Alphaproteobacteria bacterium]|nr:PAS domain-containing protein [Alphaproteobacteria bacterium]